MFLVFFTHCFLALNTTLVVKRDNIVERQIILVCCWCITRELNRVSFIFLYMKIKFKWLMYRIC